MELTVTLLKAPGDDDEELDRVTTGLLRELRDLDVDRVERVAGGDRPAGSRAVDGASLGEIAIALGAAGGALTVVVETLREWLARHGNRRRLSVTIDGDTIELERASDAERADLVRAYVQRHQSPPAPGS
jgi:hypothetical protein